MRRENARLRKSANTSPLAPPALDRHRGPPTSDGRLEPDFSGSGNSMNEPQRATRVGDPTRGKPRVRHAASWMPSRGLSLGLLVVVASFALFAFTATPPLGYERETAAVTEGLVERGELRAIEGSPLLRGTKGLWGREGRGYGRATIIEHVLQAPVYALGAWLDKGTSGASLHGRQRPSYLARQGLLTLFNPLMAALGAAAVFGIVALRSGSCRWGVGVAAAFSLGSIAWPYSKIGMETTFMALLAITLLLVVVSLRAERLSLWVVTGVVAGAAAVAKPYGPIAVAPLFIPLADRLRAWPRRTSLTVLLTLAVPMLVWGSIQLLYNLDRFGSILSFGPAQRYSPTLAAPVNLVGFMVSPGKGLFLYSPLVILGAFGLRALWRRDRLLALTVLAGFASIAITLSGSAHWSDETWGPRYLVPVAWLLLLPLPYWYGAHPRPRVLALVAGVAVVVQLLAISAPYNSFLAQYRALTDAYPVHSARLPGQPDRTAAPFGRDPYRWIPELSPLLLRAELVASGLSLEVSGKPLEVTYAPFLGPLRTVILDGTYTLVLPDVWWRNTSGLGLLSAAVCALVAGVGWLWLALGTGPVSRSVHRTL